MRLPPMKNGSIHTTWLAFFAAAILFSILLYFTGYIDFLISKDTLGIAFSLFLIFLFGGACLSQYKSAKKLQHDQAAIYEVHQNLKDVSKYTENLGLWIDGKAQNLFPNTTISDFFHNIKRCIELNPNQPLSEHNLESFEAIIDESFSLETSNENEHASSLSVFGMLGTFMGICYGFASVDWASITMDNAFGIVVGVMSGISIALITSILGIIFSIFIKKRQKSLNQIHHSAFLTFSSNIQEMGRILCHENSYQPLAEKMQWTKQP